MSLWSYILRRVLWAIPVLLLTILLAFVMLKPLPGSPFSATKLPPEVKRIIEDKYGINDPWYEQYPRYVINAAQGDLGPSIAERPKTVNDIIRTRFKVSAGIGLIALLIAATIGTSMGILSAMRANGWVDYAVLVLTTIGFAIPSFALASLWVQYISFEWDITPIYGWGTWQHYIGPVMVLAIGVIPYFTRLVRASMLEVLNEDFVVAARAKGLPARITATRHVLRNSLIPVLTNAGPLIGFIITGSFIVESIFGVPGIAGAFVDSVTQRDYNVILGTTVLFSTLIITLNLLVDIAYSFIDPRVRVK